MSSRWVVHHKHILLRKEVVLRTDTEQEAHKCKAQGGQVDVGHTRAVIMQLIAHLKHSFWKGKVFRCR